jgi:hypothetical protein
MQTIYQAVGGRKMFSGLAAAVLISLFAFTHPVGFLEYAGAILAALGITSTAVAAEGRAHAKARAAVATAAMQAPAPPPAPPEGQ